MNNYTFFFDVTSINYYSISLTLICSLLCLLVAVYNCYTFKSIEAHTLSDYADIVKSGLLFVCAVYGVSLFISYTFMSQECIGLVKASVSEYVAFTKYPQCASHYIANHYYVIHMLPVLYITMIFCMRAKVRQVLTTLWVDICSELHYS